MQGIFKHYHCGGCGVSVSEYDDGGRVTPPTALCADCAARSEFAPAPTSASCACGCLTDDDLAAAISSATAATLTRALRG